MSKLNVLITYRWYPLDERLIQRIRNVSPSLQVTYSQDEGEDARLLPETDILFTISIPEGASKSPRLKWIQSLSAGVDRLRDSDVWDSDIVVTTSTGIHATPIAEYVLGLMLMFTRRLHQVIRTQDKDKMWEFLRFVGGELRGQTLGIIGYGSIGREVGRLARCFGMEVLALRRSPGKEPPPQYIPPELEEARSASAATAGIQVWPPERLPELLHKSDFVLLSLPLTEETKHLIGEEELRMMKPNAYLINIARGALINENALIRALHEGWIAGAGLDVFETEPLPENSELYELSNVILTPHMAAHTTALFDRCVDVFCENLRRYMSDQPLLNVVNRGQRVKA